MTKPKRDHRTTMHVDQRVIEPLPTVETTAEVVGETTATTEGVTVPVSVEPIAPYDESKLTPEQLAYIREMQNPGRYVPREHSECAAMRPAGYRYGVVVHTERICEPDQTIIIRHCHCRFCRPWSQLNSKIDHRYKDIQTISHKLP